MIVWATARECRAKILTGDEHFHDLVGEAIMMRKQESHEFIRGSAKPIQKSPNPRPLRTAAH